MQAAGAFWAGAVRVAESTVGTPAKRRLLDRIRDALRTRHYSSRTRTERAYLGWIRRYILFHGKRHPVEMRPDEVSRFLSALAVQGKVSASTQNQTLAALIFLYDAVVVRPGRWDRGLK